MFPLLNETHGADSKPGAWRGQSITEFAPGENEQMNWRVVNDGVMGGLSRGAVNFTDADTMQFSGDLSLRNNGGFSTVRSGDVDLNLSNDLGLLLYVKGDGRTYEARFDSDARYFGRPVSFSGEFNTVAGEWQQVKVPFDSFKGSFRGKQLPDKKLNLSKIQRISILLGDKKEGPFQLEIGWIRTYGKGQGRYSESKPVKDTPDSSKNHKKLIATLTADGRFSTLKTALDTAGLTTFFQWDNALTLIAPTNEAFSNLPEGVLEQLLEPSNQKKLISVLSYHVVPGSIEFSDSMKSREVKSVEGTALKLTAESNTIRVNDAVVISSNLECSDGLIHAIDTVLLPPNFSL